MPIFPHFIVFVPELYQVILPPGLSNTAGLMWYGWRVGCICTRRVAGGMAVWMKEGRSWERSMADGSRHSCVRWITVCTLPFLNWYFWKLKCLFNLSFISDRDFLSTTEICPHCHWTQATFLPGLLVAIEYGGCVCVCVCFLIFFL